MKKDVPFDVFLFLARHSRITNLAGYNVRRYYEIIGNSVAIEVIKAIAENIKKAVGENAG